MYDNPNFLINALICIKDMLEGYTPKWLTVISGFTGNLYFLYSSLCLRFSGMHLYSFYNQINVKFILMSNAMAWCLTGSLPAPSRLPGFRAPVGRELQLWAAPLGCSIACKIARLSPAPPPAARRCPKARDCGQIGEHGPLNFRGHLRKRVEEARGRQWDGLVWHVTGRNDLATGAPDPGRWGWSRTQTMVDPPSPYWQAQECCDTGRWHQEDEPRNQARRGELGIREGFRDQHISKMSRNYWRRGEGAGRKPGPLVRRNSRWEDLETRESVTILCVQGRELSERCHRVLGWEGREWEPFSAQRRSLVFIRKPRARSEGFCAGKK